MESDNLQLSRVRGSQMTRNFLDCEMIRIESVIVNIPKTSEKILAILELYPTLGSGSLAYILGIQPKAVEKQFQRLRKSGRLSRVGNSKTGYWIVNSNNETKEDIK